MSVPTPQFFDNKNTCWSTKKRGRRNVDTPNMAYVMRTPVRSMPINRHRMGRQFNSKPVPVTSKKKVKPLPMNYYNKNDPRNYFEQSFFKTKLIGVGSFGQVFSARYYEDGITYAVKLTLSRYRGLSDRQEKHLEVYRMEQLRGHPNIVTFVNAWEQFGHLYIQTELCSCTLEEYMMEADNLPEYKYWDVAIDMLKALKFIHKQNLAHLDLKPANILVNDKDIFKLGDFGIMIQTDVENDTALEGDSIYLPFEGLEGVLGTFTDIFSLGLTLLEISCNLDLPGSGEKWEELRNGSLPGYLFEANLSTEFVSLVKTMVHPDYQKRPSAGELLSMPFMNDMVRQRTVFVNFCQAMYESKRRVFATLTRVKGFVNRVLHGKRTSSHLVTPVNTDGVPTTSAKLSRPVEQDFGNSTVDFYEEKNGSPLFERSSNGVLETIPQTPARTPRYLPRGFSPSEMSTSRNVVQRTTLETTANFARRLNLSDENN